MSNKKRRRYHGEEAEIMTPEDLRASTEVMAKMQDPSFDLDSLVVERPRRVVAVVVSDESGEK